MIRLSPAATGTLPRRQLLRKAVLAIGGLAAIELVAAVAPFFRVNKIVGLGEVVALGLTRGEALAQFAATNDRPVLYTKHRFFLMHAPGGIIAAYRKCTHLGCAVPFNTGTDIFHCPCHQSKYDKRTAVVLDGPAPRPLDLFRISEGEGGKLFVDTNPLNAIVRPANRWDPAVLVVRE